VFTARYGLGIYIECRLILVFWTNNGLKHGNNNNNNNNKYHVIAVNVLPLSCYCHCQTTHHVNSSQYTATALTLAHSTVCSPHCTLAVSKQSIPEGPATDQLNTGWFSWFSRVPASARRFPTFPVATARFSRSPPDLNLPKSSSLL
jgi:hypothetical protein